MSRPKFVQARKTTLSVGISAAESTEIVLKALVSAYGEALAMADFGDTLYLTIAPGTENEEIISATGFTVNSDGSVSIDTGITRGLDGTYPYTTVAGLANPHSAGTVVVASNNPQMYEAMIAYFESIAIAGAADGSVTTAGIFEEATTAEIDADTGAGATTRRLAVNPAQLAASKYGTRLPSADGAQVLDAVTGMVFDYAGPTTPTGFLACDGTAYNNDDYFALAAVLLGYYGYSGSNEFTADHTTETFTDVSHGMSDGNMVFVSSTADDLPNGLTANTAYYVVNSTTNTFQLSLTVGGSAEAISDNGSGTLQYHTQFKVPDLRGSTIIGKGTKSVAITFLASNITPSTVGTTSVSSATNDTVTFSSAHGLATGDSIVFDTTHAGITAGTVYYVAVSSSTVIRLFTTRANAVLYASPHNNTPTPVNITLDTYTGYTGYKACTFTTTTKLPKILQNGAAVALTTSGSLPTGLSATTYYLIRLTDYTFQLAANKINAVTYTEAIAVSTAGSGTHTITHTLSARTLGDSGGEENHQLMISEMPSHDHAYGSFDGTAPGGSSSPTGGPTDYTDYTGGDTPANVMQPFVTLNKIIKT